MTFEFLLELFQRQCLGLRGPVRVSRFGVRLTGKVLWMVAGHIITPSSVPACLFFPSFLLLSEDLAPFPQAGTEAAVITNQACGWTMEGKGWVPVVNTPLIKPRLNPSSLTFLLLITFFSTLPTYSFHNGHH